MPANLQRVLLVLRAEGRAARQAAQDNCLGPRQVLAQVSHRAAGLQRERLRTNQHPFSGRDKRRDMDGSQARSGDGE